MMWLQVFVDTASIAACYVLVALGFILVLNTTGAVNFCHGDLVMVGGMAGAVLASHLALPIIVLFPALMGLMALIGLAVAAIAYLPLRRRPADAVFVSTIATGVILQNLTLLLFGPDPRAAPPIAGIGAVALLGLSVDRQKLAMLGSAGALITALYVILRHTRFGWRMRACAQDASTASLLGIHVTTMTMASFALAAMLAGTAGLLLAHSFSSPRADGANYILKAYMAAVIGGWGSLGARRWGPS